MIIYCSVEKRLDGRVNPKSGPGLKKHSGAININVAKNSRVFQTKRDILQMYFPSKVNDNFKRCTNYQIMVLPNITNQSGF